MKKKLLSPLELKKFRAEQEARRVCVAQLEKTEKRLTGPKELLDPKPVVEVVEEPVVEEPVVEEVVEDPIDLLQERVEEFAIHYSEELSQLEVRLANKLEFDDVNLQPIRNNIKRLRDIVDELPEVKYYDDDLEKLTERVDQLQVSGSETFQQHGENLKEIEKVIHQMLEDLVKLDKREIPEAFDPTDIQTDIAATKETFYERVAELRKELSELPEVKYYDDELTQLQERIEVVRDSIPEIPEIKYYDDDLENLLGLIEEVRGNVSQLPEVKYYENEISQLEEAIKSVEDRIPTVPEVRYYEDDIETLREEIKNVEGQIPEVPEIPEIKYYDEEVEILSKDIDKIRDSLIDIKLAIKSVEKSVEVVEGREIPEAFDPTGLQIEIEKAFKEIEKLKEQPVTVKEDADPLVPLDQNFVTFDDLAEHYRTFIVRVQQQLSSIGGGGETRLEFLDDVDRNSAKTDGYFLQYQASTGKFVGAAVTGGGGVVGSASTWDVDSVGINTVKNVGIGTTAKDGYKLYVEGDARVTGILTVGPDSVTIDGINNRVTSESFVGNLTGSASLVGGASSTFLLNYNNFTNTPTIPSDTGDLTNSVGFVTSNIVVGYATEGYVDNLVGISTFSGDYNDLTNQPTIPDTSGFAALSGATFTGNVDLNNTVYLRLGNDKDNIIGYNGSNNLFRFTDSTTISGDTMFFTTYNGVEYMRLSTSFGTQLKHQGTTKLTVDSTGITVNGQLNDLTIPSGIGTIAITADIPTNNNELTNGAGYITSSSLVGLASEGYVDAAVSGVSIPLSALTDVNTSNLSGISTDYLMVYDPSIPGFKFVNPKTYFGINNDANPAPDIVDYGTY